MLSVKILGLSIFVVSNNVTVVVGGESRKLGSRATSQN